VVTLTAALSLLGTGLGVVAHDDSMPGNGQVPPHARDTMRAFAADHHHTEDLAAQSITTCVVNPVYLGHLSPHQGVANSSWRDIKVFANHAFIGSEALGSGLQVMDLAQLRNVPSPPVTFVETAHYTGFSTSHNDVPGADFAHGLPQPGLHPPRVADPEPRIPVDG
jgi:hypothetical protein